MQSIEQYEISDELELKIKDCFSKDRENRFQLFLLCSGIRKKYLCSDGNYHADFVNWYEQKNMNSYFGKLPNFTKYAGCGDVVDYVSSNSSNTEKYLNQLPVSVGALYEISIILKTSQDLFNLCLHFTTSRKHLDEPRHEWKTKRPPLIRIDVTELEVRTWRRKFENPPPPKKKRTDKRTLPFVEITCNGELFNFDKKTGEKTGILDLDEVEVFFQKLTEFCRKEIPNEMQFKISDSMDYLTEGYYKRKERVDPARNVQVKKTSSHYK